jgi:hypothetical protein
LSIAYRNLELLLFIWRDSRSLIVGASHDMSAFGFKRVRGIRHWTTEIDSDGHTFCSRQKLLSNFGALVSASI